VPQCLPVPQGLGMVEAAALPETFFTVWQNVFDRARLKGGETILIHGGSSGIGTTSIQMAKAMGARVLATAGTDEKCAACVKIGADRAFNYNTQDFVEATLAATNKKGADVILDMVGGKYFERNIAALAIEGRLSVIALLGGRDAKIDLGLVLRKRLTVVGSVLRARPIAEKGAVAVSLRREIWPFIAAGKIKPVIDSTFPLADAAKAHARMETSAHVGKIVLTV
jgi:NADPH2:quinone reductase